MYIFHDMKVNYDEIVGALKACSEISDISRSDWGSSKVHCNITLQNGGPNFQGRPSPLGGSPIITVTIHIISLSCLRNDGYETRSISNLMRSRFDVRNVCIFNSR